MLRLCRSRSWRKAHADVRQSSRSVCKLVHRSLANRQRESCVCSCAYALTQSRRWSAGRCVHPAPRQRHTCTCYRRARETTPSLSLFRMSAASIALLDRARRDRHLLQRSDAAVGLAQVLLAAEYFDEPPALAVVWQRRFALRLRRSTVLYNGTVSRARV